MRERGWSGNRREEEEEEDQGVRGVGEIGKRDGRKEKAAVREGRRKE